MYIDVGASGLHTRKRRFEGFIGTCVKLSVARMALRAIIGRDVHFSLGRESCMPRCEAEAIAQDDGNSPLRRVTQVLSRYAIVVAEGWAGNSRRPQKADDCVNGSTPSMKVCISIVHPAGATPSYIAPQEEVANQPAGSFLGMGRCLGRTRFMCRSIQILYGPLLIRPLLMVLCLDIYQEGAIIRTLGTTCSTPTLNDR